MRSRQLVSSGVRMISSAFRRRAASASSASPDDLDARPRVAADRVGDQQGGGPRPDDQGPPPRPGKQALEKDAPEGDRRPVQQHEDHEDRPGERVGLREGQEENRGERQELKKERRDQKPAERVSKALPRSIEAEQRQRDDLCGRDQQHVGRGELDVPGGQEGFRPGDPDAGADPERERERRHRDGDVPD